jgi:hypothetical protein
MKTRRTGVLSIALAGALTCGIAAGADGAAKSGSVHPASNLNAPGTGIPVPDPQSLPGASSFIVAGFFCVGFAVRKRLKSRLLE